MDQTGFHLDSYSSHFSLVSPQPTKNTNQTYFAPRYMYSVGGQVRKMYKAAGVLIVARDPMSQRLMMLLGREDRTKRVGKHRTPLGYFWLHFQGKREVEDQDNPCTTAMRELVEETGGVLGKYHGHIRKQVYDHTTPKLWYKNSKYVLFVVNIPFDRNIPHAFAQLEHSTCKDMWQTSLRWMPVRTLYRMSDAPKNTRVRVLSEPLYPFFCTLLRLQGTRRLIREVTSGTPVYTCDFVKDWRIRPVLQKDSVLPEQQQDGADHDDNDAKSKQPPPNPRVAPSPKGKVASSRSRRPTHNRIGITKTTNRLIIASASWG